MTGDWRTRAACAAPDVDPEWFAVRAGNTGVDARALATCHRCPVRGQCHTDAQAATPDRRQSVVLAGVVYTHTGQPGATQLARCARTGCRTMVPASGTRKFCSDACMRAAEALRRLRRTAKTQHLEIQGATQ